MLACLIDEYMLYVSLEYNIVFILYFFGPAHELNELELLTEPNQTSFLAR